MTFSLWPVCVMMKSALTLLALLEEHNRGKQIRHVEYQLGAPRAAGACLPVKPVAEPEPVAGDLTRLLHLRDVAADWVEVPHTAHDAQRAPGLLLGDDALVFPPPQRRIRVAGEPAQVLLLERSHRDAVVEGDEAVLHRLQQRGAVGLAGEERLLEGAVCSVQLLVVEALFAELGVGPEALLDVGPASSLSLPCPDISAHPLLLRLKVFVRKHLCCIFIASLDSTATNS